MAEISAIEWTDATWNPITGCSVVSPGCTNCYAMRLAGTRLQRHPSRAGLTRESKAGPVWTGEVRLNEEWLTQPLQWRRPRKIFVCAHGDLFAEGVPDAWIDRVFAVMALAPRHTFQVLTKRSARMRAYLQSGRATPVGMEAMGITLDAHASNLRSTVGSGVKLKGDIAHLALWPLPNVWLGVSAEDQRRADERVPDLLATPANVRFVSAEPLLEDVQLRRLRISRGVQLDALRGMFSAFTSMLGGFETAQQQIAALPSLPTRLPGLAWVICGGESGPGARPMHPDWARSLRDQCASAGVPFHFKQWGEFVPVGSVDRGVATDPNEFAWECVGKKVAGRLLDGVEHNGMPATITPALAATGARS